MLPFVTRTDLNDAAIRAHVSHEVRNNFLKALLAEHSQNGAREQLKELWSAWVDKNYASEGPPKVSGNAPTPPDSPAGWGCAIIGRLPVNLRALERCDGGAALAGEVAALTKARLRLAPCRVGSPCWGERRVAVGKGGGVFAPPPPTHPTVRFKQWSFCNKIWSRMTISF